MRNSVLYLSFLLNIFAVSESLLVLAQDSRRNLSESELDYVALGHIDANRTLQTRDEEYSDGGERGGTSLLRLTQSNPESLVPLLEPTRAALKAEQMLAKTESTLVAKTEGTLVAKKGPISSFKQVIRATTTMPYERYQRLVLKREYKELQDLLDSTPKRARYDKLMLLGHSPFSWKFMIDARGSKGFTDLPVYKPVGTETELERLEEYTIYVTNQINYAEPHPKAMVWLYDETISMLSDDDSKKLFSLTNKVKKLIQEGHSVDDFVRHDITPVVYARALLKIHHGLPDRQYHYGNVNSGSGLKGWILNKLKTKIVSKEDRVKAFLLYVEAYQIKLQAILDKIKTSIRVPP